MNLLTERCASSRPLDNETLMIEWTPLIDITENDKEYLIEAELPEVDRQNLKVSLEDGALTISGERRFAFTHKFSLPRDSAGDKVSAHFKDGVLKVYVLKNPAARSESIGIKVG
jgi:HSP20 family protein